jgi:hypothetical protein
VGKKLASLLIVTFAVVVPTGLLLLSMLESSPETNPNLFGLPGWAFVAARGLAIFGFVTAIMWLWAHRRFTKTEARKQSSKSP